MTDRAAILARLARIADEVAALRALVDDSGDGGDPVEAKAAALRERYPRGWLSVEELAHEIGVSGFSVKRWARNNEHPELRAFKVGRIWRFPVEGVGTFWGNGTQWHDDL